MDYLKSLGYFLLAGILRSVEAILFGYGSKEGKGIHYAIIGAFILVLYGIIPTLQPANFGRVYAAYGGVFIALSLLWGWAVDGIMPDHFDLIGGLIALVGVGIIMYAPR